MSRITKLEKIEREIESQAETNALNKNKYYGKGLIVLCFAMIMSFTACASTGSSAGISLQEAIEQSAERIAGELSQGSRVAIVAFESPNDGLSNFIIEELTGALFDRGIEIADRKNLEFAKRELHFQMSGEVSDESAASIGKFLGAENVITGDFSSVGSIYRYRASAINVEQAVRTSVSRLDVAGGREIRDMIKNFENQKSAAQPASHEEGRISVPRTAGAFLDRGITLASQGEWEMAILDFTEALVLNPNLSAAYRLRGRAAYASASDVINIGENFESVSIQFQGWRQLIIKETQAYDRAIADFTEAIRLDGNNAVAYSNRGEAYLQKGELDNAIADFNQAIRLNPRSASAYNNRGIAYQYKNDIDKAISDYTQSIRYDPQFSYPYYNRGGHYFDRNDYDRAIADYNQAIRINPNYTYAYFMRGFVYISKRDYDRAIADFTQAIRIDTNYAHAYFMRGVAYCFRASGGDQARAKEDFDRAIADYTQAIRLDMNYLDAYIERALANYNIYHSWSLRIPQETRQAYYRQAFADLRKAHEMAPDNETVNRFLATWGR